MTNVKIFWRRGPYGAYKEAGGIPRGRFVDEEDKNREVRGRYGLRRYMYGAT